MDFKTIGKSAGAAFKSLGSGIKRHSPEICVAFGLCAGVGAIATAVTGTIKAKELINKKKAELGVEKLSVKETIKTVWKCYIPTASLGIISAAATISGSKISLDRTAAMGALYNAGRDALNDYQKATEETVGKETEEQIEAKATDKRQNSEEQPGPLYFCGNEKFKFIDSLTNMRVYSTKNEIDAAVNDFNAELIDSEYLSLNDWLTMLPGGKECEVGNMLYWHIQRTGKLRITYGYGPDEVGKPCYIIYYSNPPRYLEDY